MDECHQHQEEQKASLWSLCRCFDAGVMKIGGLKMPGCTVALCRRLSSSSSAARFTVRRQMNSQTQRFWHSHDELAFLGLLYSMFETSPFSHLSASHSLSSSFS